jgi:threonine/homoserine/homoserine lactone efflux protein
MLAPPDLWLFLVLVAGIIVLPGMDMAFVLASTLAHGKRAGIAAVAGLVCGGLLHLALAATGIGFILASEPRLANALLLTGCAYLCWIGWQLWRHGAALGEVDKAQTRDGLAQTFFRAVLTCLLNPKAYMFMLAVFPRFIGVNSGSGLEQVWPLALITAATQMAVYGSVVGGASRFRRAVLSNTVAQARLGHTVGLILTVSAGWALISGWQP